jgi:Leucine-rich repeat
MSASKRSASDSAAVSVVRLADAGRRLGGRAPVAYGDISAARGRPQTTKTMDNRTTTGVSSDRPSYAQIYQQRQNPASTPVGRRAHRTASSGSPNTNTSVGTASKDTVLADRKHFSSRSGSTKLRLKRRQPPAVSTAVGSGASTMSLRDVGASLADNAIVPPSHREKKEPSDRAPQSFLPSTPSSDAASTPPQGNVKRKPRRVELRNDDFKHLVLRMPLLQPFQHGSAPSFPKPHDRPDNLRSLSYVVDERMAKIELGGSRLSAVGLHIGTLDAVDTAFTNIENLYLGNNYIERLDNIVQFSHLKTLSLANNNMYDITALAPLAGISKLKTLYCEGNPICELPTYRLHVMAYLPQLLTLDGRRITANERKCALQLVRQETNLLNLMFVNDSMIDQLRRATARLRVHLQLYETAFGRMGVFNRLPPPDIDVVTPNINDILDINRLLSFMEAPGGDLHNKVQRQHFRSTVYQVAVQYWRRRNRNTSMDHRGRKMSGHSSHGAVLENPVQIAEFWAALFSHVATLQQRCIADSLAQFEQERSRAFRQKLDFLHRNQVRHRAYVLQTHQRQSQVQSHPQRHQVHVPLDQRRSVFQRSRQPQSLPSHVPLLPVKTQVQQPAADGHVPVLESKISNLSERLKHQSQSQADAERIKAMDEAALRQHALNLQRNVDGRVSEVRALQQVNIKLQERLQLFHQQNIDNVKSAEAQLSQLSSSLQVMSSKKQEVERMAAISHDTNRQSIDSLQQQIADIERSYAALQDRMLGQIQDADSRQVSSCIPCSFVLYTPFICPVA